MIFGLFLRSPQLNREKRKTKNGSIGQLHPGKESLEQPNSIRSKLQIRWRGIGRRWTITYENVPGIESVAASAGKSASVNLEKKTFLETGDSHEKPQSSAKTKRNIKMFPVRAGWRKFAFKRKGGKEKKRERERKRRKKNEKPVIERLHPGFQKL